jgi:hypothetical protein
MSVTIPGADGEYDAERMPDAEFDALPKKRQKREEE